MLKNSTESGNMTWILANTKPCPQCKCVVFGLVLVDGSVSAFVEGLQLRGQSHGLWAQFAWILTCLAAQSGCMTTRKETFVHRAALLLNAYALFNPPPRPISSPLQAAD